jgi:hypothetical protein
VTEAPSGGSLQPFYLDGRKILNSSAVEDFAATIQAFSAPTVFNPCIGRSRLSQGLYAANQPKAPFNFSYRTLIGNDLVDIDYGYKIHLVYNAVAKAADNVHTTDADTPSVKTYSWDVATYPVSIAGYKPTSHFIFDTRYVQPYIIGRLEAILYGDDNHDPRMPTPDEVSTLLISPPDSNWWDLTGNIDFPPEALIGDMGLDFSTGDVYYDMSPDSGAYWWDLTGDLDFPPEALVNDWGYDTVTGEVWKNTG